MGAGAGKNKRVNKLKFLKAKPSKQEIDPTIYPGIFKTSSGRYFVEKNGDKYFFGDQTTLEQAKELYDADPRLDYQDGDCGQLANELWNRHEQLEYYYLQTSSDPDIGIHQFVKTNDNYFVDSMGLWSEEAMLSSWQEIDSSIRLITWDEGHPEDKNAKRNPDGKIYNKALYSIIKNNYIK